MVQLCAFTEFLTKNVFYNSTFLLHLSRAFISRSFLSYVSVCCQDGQHREILTVYELAFLLLRVQVVAQVEDDWKEEHEAGHGDDWHVLLVFQ